MQGCQKYKKGNFIKVEGSEVLIILVLPYFSLFVGQNYNNNDDDDDDDNNNNNNSNNNHIEIIITIIILCLYLGLKYI